MHLRHRSQRRGYFALLLAMLWGGLATGALRAEDGAVEAPVALEVAAGESPVTGLEVAHIDRDRRQRGSERVAAGRVDLPPFILQSTTTTRQRAARQRVPSRCSWVAVNAFPLPEDTRYWAPDRRQITQRSEVGRIDELPHVDLDQPLPGSVGWDEDDWSGEGEGFFQRELATKPKPPLHPKVEGLKRLASKIGLRHLRKELRSELRDRFEEDPSMDYFEYLEARTDISRIGRGADFIKYDVDQVRNAVLENDPDDFERHIVVADWGLLRIDDRGNLRVDVSKLRKRQRAISTDVELAPEDRQPEPLFQGRTFKFSTDARFKPRPHKLINGAHYREVIGKLGLSFEMDFYTTITQRRYMKAELETTYDEDREAAVFFNLVLYEF